MNRLIRMLATGGSAAVLTLAAAGCGSGTVSDPGGDGNGNGTGEISVETARGPVGLPEPAARVVSLEYAYTEELLALGVEPVGVADSEGYRTWVSAEGTELPGGVEDVGTRQEPSIEKIRALEPDLIVSDEDRLKENFDQLEEIAPVVSFQPTDEPQLDTMRTNFAELGKAVGKEDEAEQVLADLDEKTAEVEERLDEAGRSGETFALAQGFSEEGAPSIRMFTGDAAAAALLESVGLDNGWDGEPDEWGMTTVGVEGLTRVEEDAVFLYVAAEEDNPFTGELRDNSVWQDLSFVADDRVAGLDPGTWLFGGPLSSMQLLEETAKAFEA
ncbi:ABC transporter substrate-binding protein [Allosalinactinospora lopnorensis]|uniref:ABC transporter substrate-binding protein n=1 Tax=Allosalinactinospora lopnorensis TaxID=1352348 RepID=UPI000623CB64|nr:iron-siderophore ABC transporter substrate-binding protein [Allosalinactinospora lopnorensis]